MPQTEMIQTNFYKLVNEQILGPSPTIRYVIPQYQREYVWSHDEWEALFSDLIESCESSTNESSHYFGSFVFYPDEDEHNQDKEHYEYYKVVDGQQRLTTISILFLVIYQRGAELLCELKKRTDTTTGTYGKVYDDRKGKFDDILNRIYCTNNVALDESKVLKLRLSNSSNNNENYESLTKDIQTLVEKLLYKTSKYEILPTLVPSGTKYKISRIYKAHKYFYSEILIHTSIDDIHESTPSEDINEQIEQICTHLELLLRYKNTLEYSWCCIKNKVNDMNDAFTLFDTLNNRGVDLSQVDIVKNYIFATLERTGHNLDDADDRWVEMKKLMKSSTLFKKFFVDYYNNYSNKYGVTNNHNFITESGIIKAYKELIQNIEKRRGTTLSIDDFYNDLQNKSRIYQIITNPTNVDKIADYEDNIFEITYVQHLICLNSISGIPSFGLLAYLYDKLDLIHITKGKHNKDKKEITFEKIVFFLTRFFAIRHITNYPYVKVLPRLFWAIQKDLENVKKNISEIGYCDFLEIVKKYIQNEREYKDFLLPLKKDIRDELMEYEYEKNTSVQSIIRYLFTIYEYSNLQNKNNTNQTLHSEALRDFWKREYAKKKDFDFSIEHILPQGAIKDDNNKCGWYKMLGDELNTKEEFQDKLGNLLLLKQSSNSKLSQKPFCEKCVEYNKVQYYAVKSVVSNNIVWKKEQINMRTEALVSEIVNYLTEDIYPIENKIN